MARFTRPALIGLLLCALPLAAAAQDNPWRVPVQQTQPPVQMPPQDYVPETASRVERPGYAALGIQHEGRNSGMGGGTLFDGVGMPRLGSGDIVTTGRNAQATTGQNYSAATPPKGWEQRYDMQQRPQPQQVQQQQPPLLMLGDFAPLDRDVTMDPAPPPPAARVQQPQPTPSWSVQQRGVIAPNGGGQGGWRGQPQPQPQAQPLQQQQTPSWSAQGAGYGNYAYGNAYAQQPQPQPQMQRQPAPQQQPGYGGYGYGYAPGAGYGDLALGGPSTLNAPYPSYGGYGFPYGTGVPGSYGW